MRHATIEDFDVVKGIFKENRDVFPYLRFDSLKHKIKEGKVVYDTGVVTVSYTHLRAHET